MVDPHEDPIELVPSRYEDWREQFAAERGRIRDVLASRDLLDVLERVEHVGSTAVPGLAAKDIVDIDVVVAEDAVAAVATAIAADLGGDRSENAPTWQPVFRQARGQRFNDHVFGVSDDGWRVSVASRDVLRARPDRRAEYERRKREAAAGTDDLQAYSRQKTPIVEELLATAREAEDLCFDFEIPTL